MSTGALLTFLNGAQTVYYTAQGTSVVRLSAAIDAQANGLGTGAHDVLIAVTANYGTGPAVNTVGRLFRSSGVSVSALAFPPLIPPRLTASGFFSSGRGAGSFRPLPPPPASRGRRSRPPCGVSKPLPYRIFPFDRHARGHGTCTIGEIHSVLRQ